jgi:hypothetical protein
VAHLGSANRAIGGGWGGPKVSERVAASADMSTIGPGSGLKVTGLRLLQSAPAKQLLQMTFQLADSPRAVDPSNGLLGDEADFSFVDGSKLKGVVTREAAGIVTIESASTRISVQRSAIVKIVGAARYVGQQARVTIPIDAPADAHYLQLLVSTPRQLETNVLRRHRRRQRLRVGAISHRPAAGQGLSS